MTSINCNIYKYFPFTVFATLLIKLFCAITVNFSDNHHEFVTLYQEGGARGGAVGWGTTLQVGRSRVRFPMVSLEFFIDIILPAALWPWGWLSLQQKWELGYFLGVKAAGAYGWQPYHLRVPTVMKSGSLNLLEPSGPAQVCNGIALPFHK